MSSTTTNSFSQLALITCSYAPDFERCVRLCRSVDTYVPDDAHHHLIVPQRDWQLFSSLQSPRRTVISVQDVLPGSYRQLPLASKWWVDPGFWPVRGWMLQQLIKLSADSVTDREFMMFLDSDIEFVKPMAMSTFIDGEQLRLHRLPGEKNEGVHLKWHQTAARLLGLPIGYLGSDYIAPLVTWRRSNLIALKQLIEEKNGKPWYRLLGQHLTVSEYTLYGAFVDHIMPSGTSGHFHDDSNLCHCCWFEQDKHTLLKRIREEDKPLAVLLQSNMGLPLEEIEELMNRVTGSLAV